MKKRTLLVLTGTVGALGGVFAITPPQFGNSAGGLGGSDAAASPAPQQSSAAPAPTPKSSAEPAPSASSKKGGSATTKQSTPAPTSESVAPMPTPTPTKAAGSNVTVTGNTFAADEGGRNWGNVTVRVTFTDGQITSIVGNQSPTSRGQWAFNQLDPYVTAQKITIAQIKSKNANALPYVSGVSYSSMAYWESLKSAISKAGL
jgi:hypothetical protein